MCSKMSCKTRSCITISFFLKIKKMEGDLFTVVVMGVTAWTFVLLPESQCPTFLRTCLLAQTLTLVGLLSNDPLLVRIGHLTFSASMWYPLPKYSSEWYLVISLLCFTLFTRHAFQGCLFSKARGSTAKQRLTLRPHVSHSIVFETIVNKDVFTSFLFPFSLSLENHKKKFYCTSPINFFCWCNNTKHPPRCHPPFPLFFFFFWERP